VDAGLIGAWGTAVAGVIGSVGIVLKIVLTRPRIPVAEEVLERLAEVEEALLAWATWAHLARMAAAAAGVTLPATPLDTAERREPHALPTRLAERVRRTDTDPALPAQRGTRGLTDA